MPAIHKNNVIKITFVIVGTVNALIDFGTLFLLTSLGVSVILANIVSTTTAFFFSFYANKNYTFKAKSTNVKREMLLFTVVTLFGLWFIQGIILKVALIVIGNSLPPTIALFAAKALAAIVGLVWNYLLYSRVVFKNNKP